MVKILSVALGIGLFGLFPVLADAATLSFSEPADSYATGSIFSLSVYVDSPDQAMNAASGVVSFPWNTLEVVSISKTNSIFSLWAQEPSFSNSAGTVSFEGVVMNPGFMGAKGKIVSITFKAKAAGQANLSFSSGSVLANDGTGTSILKGLGVAVVNISSQPSMSPAPREEVTPEQGAPRITSVTHPDQTKWYANGRPEFSWALPPGALEVRTLMDTSPKSQPTKQYVPPISSKLVENLPDGIHYFHLQIRTASGWGVVGHYRLNIDTTPPKQFSITFPHGTKGFEPQPVILFDTTDAGSVVSHYDVKIGSGGANRAGPGALSNPYPLPPQDPGEHVVTVIAYDRAGNTTSASSDFTIEGIEAPVITSYPKELDYGDLVRIRGTTYENSDIAVRISRGSELVSEEQTRSNSLGDFALIVTKRLDPGVYTFTARVTDARGARSKETVPQAITVKSRFFADFMESFLTQMSLVTLAVLALLGSIAAGLMTWRRLSRRVHRLRREGEEAEEVLEESFESLRENIDKHITLLQRVRSREN